MLTCSREGNTSFSLRMGIPGSDKGKLCFVVTFLLCVDYLRLCDNVDYFTFCAYFIHFINTAGIVFREFMCVSNVEEYGNVLRIQITNHNEFKRAESLFTSFLSRQCVCRDV